MILPKMVLVVESDVASLYMLTHVFSQAGVRLKRHTTGRNVLLYALHHINTLGVILFSLDLPTTSNPIQIARDLYRHPALRPIPIIALASKEEQLCELGGQTSPFCGILMKPLSPRVVIESTYPHLQAAASNNEVACGK